MAKKENKVKKKGIGLLAEFKAFVSKGNALDMAVGVVLGGAFSAIVTAVVNILVAICTWGIPGGLAGLVTVLPAANPMQEGFAGIGQKFAASDLEAMVQVFKDATPSSVNPRQDLLTLYTKHGGYFIFNGAAIIDWGTLINAVIVFFIIAVVLFIIVKTVVALGKAKAELENAAREAYYKKHPEERPVPPDPEKPEPTDHELLKEMLKIMKENQAKDK